MIQSALSKPLSEKKGKDITGPKGFKQRWKN
jgi:hypothetical protein